MRPHLLLIGFVTLSMDAAAGEKDAKNAKDWPYLQQYLDLALPQPDGKNLTLESRAKVKVKQVYLDDDAKDALRLDGRAPKGLEDRINAFVKGHILRIKLTGVTAVESEDVQAFLKTLMPLPPGLSDDEKKLVEGIYKGEADAGAKAPKRGWIVEVRGYTFHNKAVDLIRDTFLENLAVPEEAIDDIPDEVKTVVRDRVGFVMLYKTQVTKDGSDPSFKSPLRTLAEGGKLGKDARAIDKIAFKVDEPKRGKAEPAVARTDFSVIFIWRAAEMAKKGD
ncbi:MAG: hypothetical protein U0793_04365 [Gemmataceae bacterium]